MRTPILYVHGIAEIGGAERDLLAILSKLDRRKWLPSVACPGHGPLAREVQALDVPLYPIRLPAWRKVFDMPRRLPALVQLIRIISAAGAKILHVNDLWWAPLGCRAAAWARIPSVVTIRQQLDARRVGHYALDRAGWLITMTSAAASVLEARGIPINRVRTITSGVDTDSLVPETEAWGTLRAAFGMAPSDLVIGCVANILAIKGQEFLIHAMASLQGLFPNLRCLLVGQHDSAYAGEVRRLVEQLGLTSRVHFCGFHRDVRPYIAAMDILVLPSRSEALGIALLEAMSMAKPAVASDVGGISEVVEHGTTGLLVPPGDHLALATALSLLLKDAGKRQQMGQAGRRRVLQRFTLMSSVRSTELLYSEILHLGGVPCV